MNARIARGAWPILSTLVMACAPEPQRVTGSFDPAPVKQVKAEANKPRCGGAPKRVTFEVKIKLSIIPADAKVDASTKLKIEGQDKDDFQFESGIQRLIPHNQEVTYTLVFEPREVGPRFATLVLEVPQGPNQTGKIVVHLVGLATCQNDEPSIADQDGDGLADKDDKDANGAAGNGPATNPDQDQDGIPDGREDKNGDGVWDRETETDPYKKDSDGDKVADGDEDINKNGKVDEGERDPKNPKG